MGNSEEEEEEDRKARIFKAQLEREQELMEENRERQIKQIKQDLDNEIKREKMINKQIEQNYQNDINNRRRNFIRENQYLVGYHLNLYNMSSSELEYWYKKINKEAERKNREMTKKMFNNNFYY